MAYKTLKSLLVAGVVLPTVGVMQNSAFAAETKAPVATEKKAPVAVQPSQKEKTVVSQVKVSAPKKTAEKNVPAPKSKSVEYSVPCLTVRGDSSHGKISYLPLKFTRTTDNKPLRVMIADDTPNGSGSSIHSSVWLAAITAAMLRNDTMHGTTISVEFSGTVDGPSAGSVTCLAILSAMDGLPLPKDFAMTGTILPDGTIGVVGGVPEKMRAAAKAGKKRIFIPAFLRFEKNEKGENIDLQRLADDLKVKLFRVENISEAYAILHGKPYKGNEYVNVREVTRLPKATEEVLTATYKEYLAKVKAEVTADPKAREYEILFDYSFSPRKAERLYQEGKIYPATLQIFRSWKAWQARKKSRKFIMNFLEKYLNTKNGEINYLLEYHMRKILLSIREEMEKHMTKGLEESDKINNEGIKKEYGDKKLHGYFPFRIGQGEFTAQIEPVETSSKLWGFYKMLLARRADADTINTASMKQLEEFLALECEIFDVLELIIFPDKEYDDFLAKLAGTLPNKKANKRAFEVERLFYSASFAADSVAEDNFSSLMRADSGRKKAENEIKRNPYFLASFEMQKRARAVHEQLQDDSEEKATEIAYHLQASLKSQISSFAMASALLVMYGADDSNDFVSHMIRNARNAAIRNMNECAKANIPCIAAICDFEMAESVNGNAKSDFNVLMAYWRASLYAKALLMSFK